MPKTLIGISALLMTLSLLFGLLNTSKFKGLRNEIITTTRGANESGPGPDGERKETESKPDRRRGGDE
jgi:hypothetical protein